VFVAEGMAELLERMETERRLRTAWRWLPTDVPGLDIELFTDAVVTTPALGAPHRTVERFVELVEETDSVRGFAPTTVDSDMDALFRNVLEGMEAELLWPPDLTETILSSHPERFPAAVGSGSLTVLTNEDLPCACAIFDDRVGLAGYDHETGQMRATVDTDAPETRRWAEALYESYRRDARPLDPDALGV
jgi:predicted transcriptional regulator